MELRARLFPYGEASMAVLRELVPPAELRFESARCAVSLARVASILEAGESARGFGVAGEAVFTRDELRSVTHFEAVCRRIVAEGRQDSEINRGVIDRAPRLASGIRLPRGFTLSKIALKPNMVGSIGDWTAEYVVGSAVATALREARCAGFELLDVTERSTGKAYTDFFQIFSDAVLGPAIVDCSVERIRSRHAEEDGKLRHLGCLAYGREELDDRPDFNRTAEPWQGWFGQASWVVRREVVAVFQSNKLRGWAFRPVLVEGTELYDSYVAQWRRLGESVAGSERSKFEGGRW